MHVFFSEQPKTPKAAQQGTIAAIGSGGPIPSPPKWKQQQPAGDKNQQTEEILNSILPPRQVEVEEVGEVIEKGGVCECMY